MRREARDRLIQAWQTAAFTGVGKVPKLEPLLAKFDRAAGIRRPPSRMQTVEETEDALDAWVRHTGGTFPKGA